MGVEVSVELSEAAAPGDPAKPRAVQIITVPPGALEVFELPRREVDGSSEMGLNDGTHTALTPNAYRVESSHPIIANQFNPLAKFFYDVTLEVDYIGESASNVDGNLGSTIDRYTHEDNYTYVLEVDAEGKIIGGEWTGASKVHHTDILTLPTGVRGS